MSDSPENWLDEVLEAHAREWIGLPVIQLKAVMTDSDAEAHGDILYLRGLLDDLIAAKIELESEMRGQYPIPSEPLFRLKYILDSARYWVPTRLEFSEPWPADDAAKLLEAWSNERRAA